MNRLSNTYWKEIERDVISRVLSTVESLRDEALADGYKYGEAPLDPQMQMAMMTADVESMTQMTPPAAPMPQQGMV